MRKINLFLIMVLFSVTLFAQTPNAFNYQAVVRNSTGEIIANTNVTIGISILQDSTTGTNVFSETHAVTTNTFGLVNLQIGVGTIVSGNFTSINWSIGSYFIEISVNGIIMGISQLQSVPFSKYSEKSGDGFSGNYNDLSNKPSLSQVSTTGDYNDLLNQPNLNSFLTHESQILNYSNDTIYLTGGSFVKLPAGFSGDYNDLINKPTGNNLGDMLYWNGTTWVMLPVGSPGQYLQLSPSNVPAWSGLALPIVTTTFVSAITNTTASSGGNVISDGGATVTARGICWSTSQNPTILDSYTSDGSGTGSFSSNIIGLSLNTIYYVRAYATNSMGTTYGSQLSFTSLNQWLCGSTISYSGQTYNSVQIGSQCWMKENLNFIPPSGNSWCFDDIISNCSIYGRLYDWSTIMNGASSSTANPSGVQGICPTDWHIPSDAEWTQLTNYLGGLSVAGGKMKEGGTLHWLSPNTGADNSSGFTALPSGYRTNSGAYNYLGSHSYIWSSTEFDALSSWLHYFDYTHTNAYRNTDGKDYSHNVRCLRDF